MYGKVASFLPDLSLSVPFEQFSRLGNQVQEIFWDLDLFCFGSVVLACAFTFDLIQFWNCCHILFYAFLMLDYHMCFTTSWSCLAVNFHPNMSVGPVFTASQ